MKKWALRSRSGVLAVFRQALRGLPFQLTSHPSPGSGPHLYVQRQHSHSSSKMKEGMKSKEKGALHSEGKASGRFS